MIGIFTKCEITARLSCSARSAHQWQHQHQNESPPRQHEQKKWKKEYWRMWRRRCKTLQWFCLKNVHCRATSIKVWKTFCALHHYQTIAKFIASVSRDSVYLTAPQSLAEQDRVQREKTSTFSTVIFIEMLLSTKINILRDAVVQFNYNLLLSGLFFRGKSI